MRVEQFVGQWLTIPESERSRMPGPGLPLGRNSRLGAGMVLGSRVWDVRSKVRIHAGPMRYSDFARILAPRGAGQKRMRDILRTYLGIGMDFELQVEIEPGTAPPLRLGGDESAGTRLGENGWLSALPASTAVLPATFSLDGR